MRHEYTILIICINTMQYCILYKPYYSRKPQSPRINKKKITCVYTRLGHTRPTKCMIIHSVKLLTRIWSQLLLWHMCVFAVCWLVSYGDSSSVAKSHWAFSLNILPQQTCHTWLNLNMLRAFFVHSFGSKQNFREDI